MQPSHLPGAADIESHVSLIGIDYGGRRIGIAVSESGVLASPHSVMRNEGDVIARLGQLAHDLDADGFVVGVARRARSSDGEEKFRRFADELRQRTCRPVVLWDETLSTVEAAEKLRDSGRQRGRDDIDKYAAAVILQSYLDDRGRRTP